MNTVPNRSNIETAKQFFAAVYAGEYDRAFAEYAHPDYKFVVGSADNPALEAAIPWAGHTHRGKEGHMQLTYAAYKGLVCRLRGTLL
jgi:uncharacterized protein